MKRLLACASLTAAMVFASGSSADAFWRTRVVYRPIVRPVVVSPYYVAPVRTVVYPAPMVYPAPVVYRAAYYAPAPVYVAPAPVYLGW